MVKIFYRYFIELVALAKQKLSTGENTTNDTPSNDSIKSIETISWDRASNDKWMLDVQDLILHRSWESNLTLTLITITIKIVPHKYIYSLINNAVGHNAR